MLSWTYTRQHEYLGCIDDTSRQNNLFVSKYLKPSAFLNYLYTNCPVVSY